MGRCAVPEWLCACAARRSAWPARIAAPRQPRCGSAVTPRARRVGPAPVRAGPFVLSELRAFVCAFACSPRWSSLYRRALAAVWLWRVCVVACVRCGAAKRRSMRMGCCLWMSVITTASGCKRLMTSAKAQRKPTGCQRRERSALAGVPGPVRTQRRIERNKGDTGVSISEVCEAQCECVESDCGVRCVLDWLRRTSACSHAWVRVALPAGPPVGQCAGDYKYGAHAEIFE